MAHLISVEKNIGENFHQRVSEVSFAFQRTKSSLTLHLSPMHTYIPSFLRLCRQPKWVIYSTRSTFTNFPLALHATTAAVRFNLIPTTHTLPAFQHRHKTAAARRYHQHTSSYHRHEVRKRAHEPTRNRGHELCHGQEQWSQS